MAQKYIPKQATFRDFYN